MEKQSCAAHWESRLFPDTAQRSVEFSPCCFLMEKSRKVFTYEIPMFGSCRRMNLSIPNGSSLTGEQLRRRKDRIQRCFFWTPRCLHIFLMRSIWQVTSLTTHSGGRTWQLQPQIFQLPREAELPRNFSTGYQTVDSESSCDASFNRQINKPFMLLNASIREIAISKDGSWRHSEWSSTETQHLVQVLHGLM